MGYDSTNDTKEHIGKVAGLLESFSRQLIDRARQHDASKLSEPEKSMYDVFRPRLDSEALGSEENKRTLIEMGDALKHHYRSNRHHPEHFVNGIDGMTLVDLVEMVCDWSAASKRKDPNGKVNLQWARDRFEISEQLLEIIRNTIDEID